MSAAETVPGRGPVLVIGTGLIGTSVGLALGRVGVPVQLRDASRTAVEVAAGRGAGVVDADPVADPPFLVVVATPPDNLADAIVAALDEFPAAVVTDVGSVKAGPLAAVCKRSPVQARRYVGGHPMAGSERSGPLAAAADIFDGRSWAVTPGARADEASTAAVRWLATTCGATVIALDPDDHDRAVARMSHLPHVMAALTAAQLPASPDLHLQLGGQGIRDVTRIAASDPSLWRQIVTANAQPLRALLLEVRAELDALVGALGGDAAGAPDGDGVAALLAAGAAGTALIPGKHNAPTTPHATVTVHVPDEPGALAALFAAAGEVAVNIEDLRIDHDPGRAYGLVEIDVVADAADRLAGALTDGGWAAHRS